ncbi:MAG: MATE family efflux transporter [Rhodanobacter sp.]|jgi:putative MATE family efflux protein|nr:MATE family efflux transporter [Rhodanobacter sp.]
MASASHSAARLTEGAIGKTLFFFSLPILAGNVLQSLNGSVNSIWVGHYLGEAALTATSNANTILFFLLGAVFGLGIAATILIGQSVGAKDLDQAKRVIGTSAVFFGVVAALVSLLGFFLAPVLLVWMRTPLDALPLAVSYLRIVFLALPALYLYAFVMMCLRGAGDSKTPFFFLLLAVGLDIVLNPILIFGVGPLPRMGIAGSAMATLIANTISLMAILVHLYRRKHFLWLYAQEIHYLRVDMAILRALVGKGVPMGLQIIVISASMIAMISLVNRFGSQTTAAFGAAMQLWNYIQMPAFAIGAAASSMAAQNVGAKRWDRVHHTARAGVAINLLMSGAVIAVIWLFERAAFGMFLPDDSLALDSAVHMNAIVIWAFLFFGVSIVLSSVVRSTGAVVLPLVIMFVAFWVVRIPFAYGFVGRMGADAIWWSFPLGSMVSLLLIAAYYRWGRWRSAHMVREVLPAAEKHAAASARVD